MDKIITFSREVKEDILRFFDKGVDGEGYIIEKDTGQKVLSDGEPLEFDNFAGIKKGSLVFIKSDINSLIELVDSIN
jgi:hypothetical protein